MTNLQRRKDTMKYNYCENQDLKKCEFDNEMKSKQEFVE